MNANTAKQREHHGRQRRPHEQAVVEAEAKRLAHAIGPYSVLHRDALADLVGAARWREGGFQRALDAAVNAGLLASHRFGFYNDATHAQDPERRRTVRTA